MALTQVDGGLLSPTNGQFYGFKSRIINGAMVIDQRNAGASATLTNGGYSLDRWKTTFTQTSKYTVQQNAGSVTPPTGYSNYLGVTSSSAYSVLAGDFFFISQLIEGFNTSDLGWGTAGASSVTLSFWVRSSLTGTFGGVLQNSAENYTYPFSFTINAANTWEQKTVTVTGPTAGTWVGGTNGVGMAVRFSLGAGSTYSGTAGSWSGSTYYSATGATSVVGTNGATFYITGVQLEKGSTATSFDYRPYGTELQLCQRYFLIYKAADWSDVYCRFTNGGMADNTGSCNVAFVLPITMRTVPTLYASAASAFSCYNGSFVNGLTSVAINSGNSSSVNLSFLKAASFTSGAFYQPLANANNTAYFGFSAEL